MPSARRATTECGAEEERDAPLVRAAVAGDPAAFDRLYRRHAGAVRRAVSDYERDADQQLDLVQETFLRAFARIGELRDPERFRPWLLQTARNFAIDHQRRRRRQPLEALGVEQEVESDRATAHELAELRELAERLERGIATLSVRDATALTLSVELGLGPAELAVALDITPNHAKVVLHRARKRLRAAVALEDGLVAANLGDGSGDQLTARRPAPPGR
jgi:RNA polymerase sigma-70 factor (ECF subfamily)